jgi:hypothetical protein
MPEEVKPGTGATPALKVQEHAPTTPSPAQVKVRPSRDVIEKTRAGLAQTDDPDTVYEVSVSQWGHDDNRYVRGQLVMRADVPENYDFGAARRNGTLTPTTISKADYIKMQRESTADAVEAEKAAVK